MISTCFKVDIVFSSKSISFLENNYFLRKLTRNDGIRELKISSREKWFINHIVIVPIFPLPFLNLISRRTKQG